jgi:hypothetical protein
MLSEGDVKMRSLTFFDVAQVLCLTLALVFLPSYPLQAATYYVDDDDCPDTGAGTEGDPYCSIQSGINAASSGDRVQVSAGTYFENITIKSGVVIKGAGAGNDSSVHSIIDGGENGSVVTANGVDSTAKLDGFMITKGKGDFGGGMHNTNSSPRVSNCEFSGNSAFMMMSIGSGGGMYNNNSSPTVSSCVFSTNTSAGNGGGMYNGGSSPMVTDCTFSDNTAYSHGGGMYNDESSPTLTNTTFSANEATIGSGGGMYNDDSSPIVSNSSFFNNTAYNMTGGAMLNLNSSPTVVNTIFYKNSAGDNGLEITNYSSSSPTLTNCTFRSIYHPAIFNNSSSPIITNSILWGGGFDMIFNELGSSPLVSYSNIEGGYTGTGNINADPMFVDSANGDLHLKPSSPCIDAGNNSAPSLATTDMDGNKRRMNDPVVADTGNGSPPIVDIGADEYFLLPKAMPMPWMLLLLDD